MDKEYKHVALIGSKYVAGVLPAINSAQQCISIIIFDWRIYRHNPQQPVMQMLDALTLAAARGVQVRVLTQHAGVRAELKQRKIESKALYHEKLVHAKLMIIDKKVVVIGSHNYTQSAFARNLEVSALVESIELAEEFQKYFTGLWGV